MDLIIWNVPLANRPPDEVWVRRRGWPHRRHRALLGMPQAKMHIHIDVGDWADRTSIASVRHFLEVLERAEDDVARRPPIDWQPRWNANTAATLARMDFVTLLGSAAACCTTGSYIPQLRKCWETGSAGDLSFKMFSILATGVALWIVYGVLKSDAVIVLANSVSLALLIGILYFKVRERRS